MRRWLVLLTVVAVAGAALALALVLSRDEPRRNPSAGAIVGPPATDPCGEPVTKPNGTPWRCTFADDFDGEALDPDRWQPFTTEETGSRKPECRIDNPDNIAVRDGVLLLTAHTLPEPVACESPAGDYRTPLTAGAVTTARLFAQTYGRVEIRAAMPGYRGKGFHSALWMYPQALSYGKWPASGEIDIVEYRTGLFGHPVPSLHRLTRGEHEIVTNYECTVSQPEEFHSYVLEWSAAGMRFVFDGQLCLLVRFDQRLHPGGRPYDQPFFVVMNQSHGIGHNIADARAPSSATLRVDSVRVWQ